MLKHLRGFTLIELIVVMAIVAILAGAAIIAINPGQRTSQARNTQRQSHVSEILNALQQYSADNQGVMPAAVTSATTATCIGTDPACKNLSAILVSQYIASIPKDPGGPGTLGTDANTQYTVLYNAATKRVTIAAPNAEGITISQTL